MTPTEQSARIERRRSRDPGWLCVGLAVVTFLAFLQLLGADFLAYGDPFFVTNNPHVRGGLNWPGITWAFHTTVGGVWQPLAWVSHMLDAQLYGMNPAGPHLTNILLHIANSVLLFLAFNRMTGAMWRSGIVAILFALHPAHVESVAWISERKGLLCAFFWALTLYAYANYAGRPRVWKYLLTLLLFVFGLMSGPLMLTVPFVLLLLDFWPLRRTFLAAKPSRSKRRIDKAARFAPHAFGSLVIEKLPFLALSVAYCAWTLWGRAQGRWMAPGPTLPLADRLGHAAVSYVNYVFMFIFPRDLSVFYPRPESESRLWVSVAAVALVMVSWKAIITARRRPYLFSGWFLFVGMMVPVIGIVWIGDEAWADRFTYLPFVGLFILIAWSSADLARRYPVVKVVASAVAIAPMIATCIQIGFWKDTRTLFKHASEVTADNYVAYTQLGDLKAAEGKFDEAAQLYSAALRWKQDDARAADVHLRLGKAVARQGNLTSARSEFQSAVKLNPNFEEAHLRLGEALALEKKYEEAASEYRAALEINPDSVLAHNGLTRLPQIENAAGKSVVR